MSTMEALEITSWVKPSYYSLEQTALCIAFMILVTLVLRAIIDTKETSSLPIINPRKRFEFSNLERIADFKTNCRQLLQKGRTMYPQKPYRMICPEGEVIVLPTCLVNQMRSEPALDFVGISKEDSHSHIPGFDPFGLPTATTIVVNRYLNKAISKLTGPISQEAGLVLAEILPDCHDWITIKPSEYSLSMVARVSSRVFLGEKLCRNKEWIQASSEYAPAAFAGAGELEGWPASLHPLVHWFLPRCRDARARLAKARYVLQPYIEERCNLKASAHTKGDPNLIFDDAIEWYEHATKHAYDPTVAQISLSMAAIHTTSDLLRETMIQLAQHEELFKPLRKEVLEALRPNGLNKTALLNLKLMDSLIKETQRHKPLLISTMRRIALKDITLSNGLVIRKGQKLLVDNLHMQDSTYYEDPLRFDAYRFLRMRQVPGQENHVQLASTSVEHMGFGHGLHACPGRFFAANEIKILLCHLLIKYEWKLVDGCIPQPFDVGYAVIRDPGAKLMIKKRQPEMDIDVLE
ncbi:Dihydromonacolin L monooxygenase LovA [Daldinia childiae]|uniref:Dihydromonacolin L monooxygenase LovA n=1 Tax=Daldinia childiae TaxID=326645 RepID=UPI001448283E|nr:Dihydromonacolin L monooxygenase LovA [Daldinia childiae]KAF3070666.1 Dihydromonacolin L monooxygenase LovA [Daldinia childiae]